MSELIEQNNAVLFAEAAERVWSLLSALHAELAPVVAEYERRDQLAIRIAENYPFTIEDIRSQLFFLSQDEDALRWALTEAQRMTQGGGDVLACAQRLLWSKM